MSAAARVLGRMPPGVLEAARPSSKPSLGTQGHRRLPPGHSGDTLTGFRIADVLMPYP